MAYLMGAVLGVAAGAVVNGAQQSAARRRAVQQQNHWRSPLSRLGRCGIFSLRVSNATSEVVVAIADASTDEWEFASDVRCDGIRGGVDRVLVHAAGQVVVIVAIFGPDVPAAVWRADQGAQTVAVAARGQVTTRAYVCRAESLDEPRPLPGPTGNDVMVTSVPWLPGLLRRQLNHQLTDQPDRLAAVEGGTPSSLRAPLAEAWWRSSQKATLEQEFLRALPADLWWTATDLFLDDVYTDTIDLVLAGPGAVFVVEFTRTATMETALRVTWQSQRLRGYLPYAAIFPLVVCEEAADATSWPAGVDGSAQPVVALARGEVLAHVQSAGLRGVGPHEVGILNAPWPRWYRQVWFAPDGAANVRFGWTEG